MSHPFFDPRDRVQVKYEMVRRHQVDGRPVTEIAARFGVSRQTFYQTASAFEAHGIPGLVPKRPGPKRSPQVHRSGCRLRRALARGRRRATGRAADGGRGAAVRRFDPRALARPGGGAPQKKTAPVGDPITASGLDSNQLCRQYEVVRQEAATDIAFARQGYGVALLMTRGMAAWLKAVSTLCLPSVGPVPAGSGDIELTPPVRSEMARVLASLVLSRVAEGVSP